jgi:hypothetical protein
MNTAGGCRDESFSTHAQSVEFCKHGNEPSRAIETREFSTCASENMKNIV